MAVESSSQPGPRPDGPAAASAEDLKLWRLRQLCTCVPFPELDWSNPEHDAANLRQLHDYAVCLAQSAIDWYGRKSPWKKGWSVTLRFFAFFFAITGALIPIAGILGPELGSRPLSAWIPDRLVEHLPGVAAEIALVLIGVAGVLSLIDRLAGFSSDWMRYKSTALQLSSELSDFEFAWNDLSLRSRGSGTAATAGRSGTNGKKSRASPTSSESQDKAEVQGNPPDYASRKSVDTAGASAQPQAESERPRDEQTPIELVQEFCAKVFDILGKETSIWATEFATSISQFPQHLHSITPGRRSGR